MNPISTYNQIGITNSYQTQTISPSKNSFVPAVQKNTIPTTNTIQPDIFKAYDDKTLKRMGIIECSTCANRTYQDGSDDSGVSFQSPTHIAPASSHAAVRGHEQEHVVRERANAEKLGGKVISQSVTIHMAICPECGRAYSSGGVTKTTSVTPVHTSTADKGKMMDLKI